MRVFLLYGSGGGGHRSSAIALKDCLLHVQPGWSVDMHDASAIVDAAFGDKIYNFLMEANLLGLMPVVYGVVRLTQPLLSGAHRACFDSFFRKHGVPDIVVSFVPFLNYALCESIPKRNYNTHVITVVTDFSSSRAHPWIQHPRQILCCGTQQLYEQALSLGFREDRVVRLSGMVVHPRFYMEEPDVHSHDFMSSMFVNGWTTKGRTWLVTFGGTSPTALTKSIVRALVTTTEEKLNVIVVCGQNLFLEMQLQHLNLPRVAVLGFRKDMPKLMQCADVVLGKPGPGIVSEAMVTRKPVVLFCPDSSVMPQEREVMRWVVQNRVGVVVHNLLELEALSNNLSRISELQTNVNALPANRAVFEVSNLVMDLDFLNAMAHKYMTISTSVSVQDEIGICEEYKSPPTPTDAQSSNASKHAPSSVCTDTEQGLVSADHARLLRRLLSRDRHALLRSRHTALCLL
ncbi:Monogalactosyldiacylglycerol synthase 3, chloroplastic [Porphyridium purpureum]|uniref:Monogalactosyldiacylglycerol synthase 3, chloroplastic n=1 Tax=Porphyridium purpureum TaxID=35688 RepID=A0A5J4YY29_PORPP|nr:Monogalactosyldiacylglycerol synthase 3, chloroplastic [Porphyridium purpureum]|eukprot:POR5619..scf209_3